MLSMCPCIAKAMEKKMSTRCYLWFLCNLVPFCDKVPGLGMAKRKISYSLLVQVKYYNLMSTVKIKGEARPTSHRPIIPIFADVFFCRSSPWMCLCTATCSWPRHLALDPAWNILFSLWWYPFILTPSTS